MGAFIGNPVPISIGPLSFDTISKASPYYWKGYTLLAAWCSKAKKVNEEVAVKGGHQPGLEPGH